jgi:CDP-diacylglycerol--serine O-phosphatidyltransferase
MVSNIPTFSGKNMNFGNYRKQRRLLEIVSLAAVALFLIYPRETMGFAILGYLGSIPFSWRRFRVTAKHEGTFRM